MIFGFSCRVRFARSCAYTYHTYICHSLPPPAQVFEVRAKTTLTYAGLAFVASLGAMEAGSMARGLLDWPVDFEETANQFDAGSFALPTRSVAFPGRCSGW